MEFILVDLPADVKMLADDQRRLGEGFLADKNLKPASSELRQVYLG
jgi:hypothetical protein